MTEIYIYIYKKSTIQCVSVCSVSSKDTYISLIQTFLSYPSVNERSSRRWRGRKKCGKRRWPEIGRYSLASAPNPPSNETRILQIAFPPLLHLLPLPLRRNYPLRRIDPPFLIRLFFEKSCSTRREYNLVQSIRIGRFLKVAKRVIHIHTDWN